MNLNWLRNTVLLGCAMLLLLSAPRINAHASPSPGLQPAGFGQDRGWDRPPDAWNDIQRRGFHDGIEGARKDFDNHRRPDVDNRDEYRHPRRPTTMWGAYREGFRRGYDVGMSHLVVRATGACVHPRGHGTLRRMNSMPYAAKDSRMVSKGPARTSTITAVPTWKIATSIAIRIFRLSSARPTAMDSAEDIRWP